jgi:hypothetical protein
MSAVQAYNRQDLQGFLSYWTDDGLESEFGATRQEIMAAGAEFFNGPPLGIRDIDKIDVKDTEATANVELVFGITLSPEEFRLMKEAADWKIDSTEPFQASIPSGKTKVDVRMDEFSFELDRTKVTSGDFAFAAENIGEQNHEIVLMKVPQGFSLNTLLQSDPNGPPPAGVEPIGFAGPYEAGEEGNMVMTEKLPAGSYMLVCFLPDEADPQGTPHYVKGMAVQFDVTGQGGGN